MSDGPGESDGAVDRGSSAADRDRGERPIEVVGLGTVVVDHIVMLEAYPTADSKNPITEDHLQVGGPVPTALVAAARFGRRCRFIGAWADDAYGQLIDADLQGEGIETAGSVRQVGGRTGFAHVWVCQATARRTVAVHRSVAEPRADAVSDAALAQARAVHLDGWPSGAALGLARRAKAAGCVVFVDTGTPKPGIDALLGVADVVNAPRRFAERFCRSDDLERAAGRLRAMGPSLVTITDGVRGVVAADGAGIRRQPAFDVEALDTTGAGDVFCGGLIHAVLAGWPTPRTLAFAAAAAAIKCRGLGNRAALPTLEQVEALARTAPRQD